MKIVASYIQVKKKTIKLQLIYLQTNILRVQEAMNGECGERGEYVES